eukprot:15445717-Alexandrium_andersonii.AAC.1
MMKALLDHFREVCDPDVFLSLRVHPRAAEVQPGLHGQRHHTGANVSCGFLRSPGGLPPDPLGPAGVATVGSVLGGSGFPRGRGWFGGLPIVGGRRQPPRPPRRRTPKEVLVPICRCPSNPG